MCTDVINAKDEWGIFGSSFGKSISSAVLEHFVLWANSTPHRLEFLQFHLQSAANWKTSLPCFLMPLMWLVFQDWIRLYSIVMYLLQPIWHLLNDKRDSSSSWLDSLISEHKKACSKAGFLSKKNYRPAEARNASTLSVFSQVNAVSEPSRPKWP